MVRGVGVGEVMVKWYSEILLKIVGDFYGKEKG